MVRTLKIFCTIALVIGAIVLSSCKTNQQEVKEIADRNNLPDTWGESMVMLYSDSARLKYQVETPFFRRIEHGDTPYDEFPAGIHATLFDEAGEIIGSVDSKYAKQYINDKLWEIRIEVVILNEEGTKLETELLYWDIEKEKVYTDYYVRLTTDGQLIEGHGGFESDQQLHAPVFKNITGIVEVEPDYE